MKKTSWQVRLASLVLIAGVAFVLTGCTGRVSKSTLDAEAHMRNAGKVYTKFMQENRGRGPTSEEELANFLKKLSDKDLETLGINPAEKDKVLISPRDGQPYGIVPNVDMTSMMGNKMKSKPGAPSRPPIAMYEKRGSGGKRYVWFVAGGGVTEMEEEKFKEEVPAAK